MAQTRNRPDKDGKHRAQFEKNKKRIYATQTVCAICGKPVDFSLKYPHPLSPTIDHIIPLDKGGHPILIDPVGSAGIRARKQMEHRKVVKVHQNVLVFYKGNQKDIKDTFPKIEVMIDGSQDEQLEWLDN